MKRITSTEPKRDHALALASAESCRRAATRAVRGEDRAVWLESARGFLRTARQIRIDASYNSPASIARSYARSTAAVLDDPEHQRAHAWD